eukprot:5156289-Pleurochrysis_carterae.AAC.5
MEAPAPDERKDRATTRRRRRRGRASLRDDGSRTGRFACHLTRSVWLTAPPSPCPRRPWRPNPQPSTCSWTRQQHRPQEQFCVVKQCKAMSHQQAFPQAVSGGIDTGHV